MTDFPASHADLLDAQFGALTTVGADGIPQATIIVFVHEDGELRISLNATRLKTRNLRRRPGCSLLIFDRSTPYRYLDVRGRVRLEPDDDFAFAELVTARFGTDIRGYDAPGEQRVVATIEPTNVYAVDMRR